jgi:hypothetical protein
MIRLYDAANIRLWRARENGTITENDFRARQNAINLWLRERGIRTTSPRDAELARGSMPIVYTVDPPTA